MFKLEGICCQNHDFCTVAKRRKRNKLFKSSCFNPFLSCTPHCTASVHTPSVDRVHPFWFDLWLKVKAADWNSIFPAMDINSLGWPLFCPCSSKLWLVIGAHVLNWLQKSLVMWVCQDLSLILADWCVLPAVSMPKMMNLLVVHISSSSACAWNHDFPVWGNLTCSELLTGKNERLNGKETSWRKGQWRELLVNNSNYCL